MFKQLAVFVENKPGSLREVTSVMNEKNVNIYAFACFDTPEFCIFRVVAEHPEEVKKVLTSRGFVTKVCDVLAVNLKDELGGLDGLLQALAESNISINYTYTSFSREGQIPVVILNTEEIDATENVLKNKGFCVLEDVSDLKAVCSRS